MYTVILILHVFVSFLLIIVILVQGGRGGMAEAFGGSGAQSLFGGGANLVMSKITAVGAGIFLMTCLSLAKLSTERGRSVVEQLPSVVSEAGLPGLIPPVPAPSEGLAPQGAAPADAAPVPEAVTAP